MNSQNGLKFKIAKSSLKKHLPIYLSFFDSFFMHQINLTYMYLKNKEKWTKPFLPFFENFNRNFGILGTELAYI